MLVCINATTGEIIYTLNGGIRPSAAANGYVIGTGDIRWKPLLHRQRPNFNYSDHTTTMSSQSMQQLS